ncbi:MAG: hypothetical protein LUI87_07285 [Lachnospiraceae bacterium]|nr:hypothetical protein [Lachnospiraceae bacterium]
MTKIKRAEKREEGRPVSGTMKRLTAFTGNRKERFKTDNHIDQKEFAAFAPENFDRQRAAKLRVRSTEQSVVS